MAEDLTPEEIKESKESLEEALKLQKEVNKLIKEQRELEEFISQDKKEALEASQKSVDAAREQLEQAIKNDQVTTELVKKLRDATKQYEDQLKYQKILVSDAEQLVESFFKIDNKTRQFSDALKQSGGFTNLLKDKFAATKEEVTKVGGKTLALNAFLKIGQEIAAKTLESLATMRDLAIEPVKEATNFDSALKKGVERLDEFRTSARDLQILDTGGIDNFRKSADALSSTFRGTSADVRELTSELFQTSNQFRELKAANDPAADSLIKTSFLLQRRLNIPIAETAQLTETLALTFGKSSAEAEGFAKSLAVTAAEMGLNVNKTFKAFEAQSNNLAKFNIPDLKREILELSAINQKTGIAIDSVVSSLEKFSTFEGALTAASQLNAVFGTTIDGLELMDTVILDGPVEGFIKLREQLETSGIQIDKLNMAQMRQLTSSIGLSAEQMKAFGEVSTEELRNITAGAMSGAEATKMLQEAQGEGETTAEMQRKTQNELVKVLDKVAVALDKITRKSLGLAEAFPEMASGIEKFGGVALTSIGALLGLPFGGVGAAVGASLGGSLASVLFAPGDNFISKPTIARVGEIGSESIMRASQVPQTVESNTGMTTVLNPGDSVQRMAATGAGATTNLTINLVGKEGRVLDSTTQTISEGQIDKAVSHYLNSKVSLLNS